LKNQGFSGGPRLQFRCMLYAVPRGFAAAGSRLRVRTAGAAPAYSVRTAPVRSVRRSGTNGSGRLARRPK